MLRRPPTRLPVKLEDAAELEAREAQMRGNGGGKSEPPKPRQAWAPAGMVCFPFQGFLFRPSLISNHFQNELYCLVMAAPCCLKPS